MKLIKISMELVIDDDICETNCENDWNNDNIAAYLNNMLYSNPEFFGDFGPENIIEVMDFE